MANCFVYLLKLTVNNKYRVALSTVDNSTAVKRLGQFFVLFRESSFTTKW